jgi:hypothetical protein
MRLACLTAMAVAILIAMPASALAVTYSVDSSSDNVTDDGFVTLQEAILASNGAPANDDAPLGAANGDRIEFNLADNTAIVLADELPTIFDDLVVDGSGVAGLTVSGANSVRVFDVDTVESEAVAIIGLGVTEGNTANSPGDTGGGIRIANAERVTLSGVTVSQSTAATRGGGIFAGNGTLTISGSMIGGSAPELGNAANGANADHGGGGLYVLGGSATLTGTTVRNNDALNAAGSGGGLLLDGGTLSVADSAISDNDSSRAGGGIEVRSTFAAATMTIAGSTLNANSTGSSPGNGGGLHVTAPPSVNPSTVEVSNSLVVGNTANQEGGGLWNDAGGTMNVNGTRIVGNTALSANAAADAQGGGGIFNNGGAVTLTNATVEANGATGPLGTDDGGGGLLNDGRFNPGLVTVLNSTLTGNHALSGLGRGGGALNLGDGDITATLVATNVTASGNGARAGGALANLANGVATLTHSTLSGNHASDGGGISNLAAATLRNSILAGSIGGDAASSSPLGYSGINIVSDGSAGCAAPACLAVDPLLDAAGPKSNGGPTETIALQAESPAVDAAFPAICGEALPQGPGGVDQRGQPRPSGPACDIGSFELKQAPPPLLPVPPLSPLPPPDTSVTVSIAGKRLRLNRRRLVVVRLTCPRAERSPPCRGRLILRTRARVRFRGKQRRRIVLARARFAIAAGRTARLRLRIARPKARLVRRNRKARRVLAIAHVSDAAGNRRTVRKRMLIVPQRKRRARSR